MTFRGICNRAGGQPSSLVQGVGEFIPESTLSNASARQGVHNPCKNNLGHFAAKGCHHLESIIKPQGPSDFNTEDLAQNSTSVGDWGTQLKVQNWRGSDLEGG